MANPTKGAMMQFMTPLVDTDGLSILSTITESDFNSGATKKFFGVNHGVSDAFTSGTISKTGRLVRSGVFQITLKGTENNYDKMLVRINKTGALEQIYEWDNWTNSDSDLASKVTIVQSMASDAASAAQQANSRVLLNQSRISDVASFLVVMSGIQSDLYSLLSDLQSDFQSRVPKRVATDSQLSDLHSDLRSYLVVMSGVQSDAYSLLSDLQSDFQSRVPKRVATDSQLSDLASDLRSVLVLNQSTLSDIYSNLSDLKSDFQSRVPKAVATNSQLSDLASDLKSAMGDISVTLTASDISDIASAVAAAGAAGLTVSNISDIASAVRAILVSDLSDILSAAQQTNSRALVVQSFVSDIRSHVSDLQSDFQSRVPKETAARSQLSDLASDLLSVVVLNKSSLSDVYSLLSDFQSDFASRVPKRVATDSQLSDVSSDLRSLLTLVESMASDAASAAQQGSSRILLAQSMVSDVQSAVAALPGLVADSVWDEATSGHTTAGTYGNKFGAHLPAVLKVVIGNGSTTTAIVLNATTGIDGAAPSATNDFYNGAVIVFTSGALAGQRTDITDYVGATVTLTVTALTGAPSGGDTAVIV